MTLKAHQGRCAHCGHDHGASRKLAEYRARSETDASASVAGVSAASDPLEVVAWEWRKRLDVGPYEGEPYYCWSEWEALQPPYMDARELAKTDPVNYELRPMVLLSDAQSRIASLTAQVESMRADKAKACHIALKKSAENECLTADLAEARAETVGIRAAWNAAESELEAAATAPRVPLTDDAIMELAGEPDTSIAFEEDQDRREMVGLARAIERYYGISAIPGDDAKAVGVEVQS